MITSKAEVTCCQCGESFHAAYWEGGEPIAEYRYIVHAETKHGHTPQFPIPHERKAHV